MALEFLKTQANAPEGDLPAPENKVCLFPKWFYPADSPCAKQDAVVENKDIFNIEKGVKQPARTVGKGIVDLKNEAVDTVSGISTRLKFAVGLVGVVFVAYFALNVYSLVKR